MTANNGLMINKRFSKIAELLMHFTTLPSLDRSSESAGWLGIDVRSISKCDRARCWVNCWAGRIFQFKHEELIARAFEGGSRNIQCHLRSFLWPVSSDIEIVDKCLPLSTWKSHYLTTSMCRNKRENLRSLKNKHDESIF
jgi:hypothetical protein